MHPLRPPLKIIHFSRFGRGEFADEATLNATQKTEFKKFSDTLSQVDTENTERLGKIGERYGWPTYSLVEMDGANAAWLLVQHADQSPKFQRKCIDLMAKLPRDEISQEHFACLTDRVLLAEDKKQIYGYGPQFTLENGRWRPLPLKDEANVNFRRAEVGLLRLAERLKESEAFYSGAHQKQDCCGRTRIGISPPTVRRRTDENSVISTGPTPVSECW